ncbi:MAG: SDR family NAD(P)-dependent oxidoreductase [Candidatus Heimdallarchaeota archaeon]|nr:SDR family NAD(P)-dependent oxidoreductase [Candidatus Heimdallarchaeota archaeon]
MPKANSKSRKYYYNSLVGGFMSQGRKQILVTGAAKGIGREIVTYLADQEMEVIAVDIDEEALKELQNRKNIRIIPMDVTNPNSIEKAVKQVEQLVEGLDGLVNNAGLFVGGPLVEIDPEEIKKVLEVNVLGMVRVTRALFPLLFKKRGRIVNMSSETGRFVLPLNGPYSMSKFAVEAFSDALRRELMLYDMKVIVIQPGAIRTDLLKTATPQMYQKCLEDTESALFEPQLKMVKRVCEKEYQKGAEPIKVAKTVHKALCSSRPKIRYRINNDRLRRLAEKLPTVCADWIVKLVMKKAEKNNN